MFVASFNFLGFSDNFDCKHQIMLFSWGFLLSRQQLAYSTVFEYVILGLKMKKIVYTNKYSAEQLCKFMYMFT